VIRVLLAEDQAMMRGALAVLLRLEPDLEVVGEVGSGDEVVPTATETRPVHPVHVLRAGWGQSRASARRRRANRPPGRACRAQTTALAARVRDARRGVEAGKT